MTLQSAVAVCSVPRSADSMRIATDLGARACGFFRVTLPQKIGVVPFQRPLETRSGYLQTHLVGFGRAAVSERARPHHRPRHRGTDYLSDSGGKGVRGSAKRRCRRSPNGPHGGVRGGALRAQRRQGPLLRRPRRRVRQTRVLRAQRCDLAAGGSGHSHAPPYTPSANRRAKQTGGRV
jgi:hypothetical protein